MPRRPDIELDLGPLHNLVKKASANRLTVDAALKSGKFAQVGFGLFRDNEDSIWEIQKGGDGVEYIIRAEETENVVESEGDWSATSDKERKNITLSHQNTPVYRFSAENFGFAADDARSFAKFLLKRTKNAEFLQKLHKVAQAEQKPCPECGSPYVDEFGDCEDCRNRKKDEELFGDSAGY